MFGITNLLLPKKPIVLRHINKHCGVLRHLSNNHVYRLAKNDLNSEDKIASEPIQFFGSNAASWQARYSHGDANLDTQLWYQPYVVILSTAIFLLYFCILREENDIDRKLEGKLFDQVEGLEKTTLISNYKYNKQHGFDTKDIEKRLTELGINVNSLNTNEV